MKTASIIIDSVTISNHGTLPNGVGFIELSYDGSYEQFKAAASALSFENRAYGKASHNSDTMKIVYRTDAKFALK
jgi:hypothetical protein